MPIQIARLGPESPTPDQDPGSWEVRDVQEDGSFQVVAGAPTRAGAMQALVAAIQPDGALTAAVSVEGPTGRAVFVEGEETRDGGGFTRVIDPGAILFDRPLPLPLMATTTTSWGHDGAELVGVITEAEVSSPEIAMLVRFAQTDEAARIVGLLRDGILTRHSPDLGDEDTEFVCTSYDEDEWGEFCTAGTLHFTRATVLGTTIIPHAALDSAMITLDETETTEDGAVVAGGLVAAARALGQTEVPEPGSVVRPDRTDGLPADWFSDPGLVGPTVPTVTADGRVFGHLACFDTCHISHLPVCVTPPRSETEYARFHTGGQVRLDDGTTTRVGHLTLGTTHAPERGITAEAAARHYEDTGTVVADVRVGEDEWGIWFSGALRADVDDWSIWALEASSLSGDWRRFEPGGNLELCAALAVNVPGFPIPEVRAVTASGECVALVAAGARTMALVASAQRPRVGPMPPAPSLGIHLEARMQAVEAQLSQLVAVTNPLRGIAAEQLVARFDRTPIETRLSNGSRGRT